MSAYRPAVGDRVRVSREGIVLSISESGETVDVDGLAYTIQGNTFELLTPPEPDRNSIVIDRENDVWRYAGGAWVETNSNAAVSWIQLIASFGPVKTYMETS